MLAETLFVSALSVPATAALFYPLAMAARSMVRRRQAINPATLVSDQPVTLVISAFNEEDSIAARLDNALSLDAPGGELRVLVVNDGSWDRTAEIVRGYADRGVELLDLPVNVGKSAALARATALIQTEVAIFTDANSRFDKDALVRLARWFSRPDVGAVCGRLAYDLDGASTVNREEDRYWRWDNWIKNAESATGHMVAGNGSILAIRTKLTEEIPSYLANDFAWMNIVRLRGLKVCFDRTAVAREAAAPSMIAEYRRRVRIITRGLSAVRHSVGYYAGLRAGERATAPEALFFFTQLVCKKLFRYLALPALLVAMAAVPFMTSLPMVVLGVGLWMAMAGLVVVGMARAQFPGRLGRLPNTVYPLAMSFASLVALRNFLAGETISTWQPHRSTVSENRPLHSTPGLT